MIPRLGRGLPARTGRDHTTPKATGFRAWLRRRIGCWPFDPADFTH